MRRRRVIGRSKLAFVVMLVAAGLAAAAWAYVSPGTSAGSGGAAKAASLPTGNTPTLALSGRDITVNWSQNSIPALGGNLGNATGGGYTITRYAENALSTPITPGSACSGTQTGNSTSLSCIESSVPTGRWTYTVTPTYDNWVGGQSAQQTTHVHVPPAAPSSITLTNGGGTGNAFIDIGNASSVNIDVALASTSLSTDTVSLKASDGTHTVTAVSQTGTSGAGTLHFTGLNLSSLNDGTITFTATATSSYGDASGNTTQTYTKDTVVPTLSSINRAGTTPTNTGPLTWTVTFSKPVNGVTPSNFSIAKSTGITGTPTISSAIASGGAPSATWTVSVSTSGVTGANGATIGLNLANNTGIQSVSGNNLTTTTFTGQAYTYDTTPPAVTLTAPSNGATGVLITPNFTGAAGTATGDNTGVTIYVCAGMTACQSGPNLAQTYTATASSGTWAFTANSTNALYTNTVYTAEAVQTDSAGNSGISSANTFTTANSFTLSTANTYTLTLAPHTTSFQFTIKGAGGGGASAAGAAGGFMSGTINLPDSSSATSLNVVVGGGGGGESNTGGNGGNGCANGGAGGSHMTVGGAGGAATCILTSSNSPVVVVGGGGGGGDSAGGAGSGGNAGSNGSVSGTTGGTGGKTSPLTGGPGGTAANSTGDTGGANGSGGSDTHGSGGDGGVGGGGGNGGGGGGGGYGSGGGGGGAKSGSSGGGGGGSGYSGGSVSFSVTGISTAGTGNSGGAAGKNNGTDGSITFTGTGLTDPPADPADAGPPPPTSTDPDPTDTTSTSTTDTTTTDTTTTDAMPTDAIPTDTTTTDASATDTTDPSGATGDTTPDGKQTSPTTTEGLSTARQVLFFAVLGGSALGAIALLTMPIPRRRRARRRKAG